MILFIVLGLGLGLGVLLYLLCFYNLIYISKTNNDADSCIINNFRANYPMPDNLSKFIKKYDHLQVPKSAIVAVNGNSGTGKSSLILQTARIMNRNILKLNNQHVVFPWYFWLHPTIVWITDPAIFNYQCYQQLKTVFHRDLLIFIESVNPFTIITPNLVIATTSPNEQDIKKLANMYDITLTDEQINQIVEQKLAYEQLVSGFCCITNNDITELLNLKGVSSVLRHIQRECKSIQDLSASMSSASRR